MTAAAGFLTLRLVRMAVGNHNGKLTLADLLPGHWRELTNDEVKKLTNFK